MKGLQAQTIHSLIYNPVLKEQAIEFIRKDKMSAPVVLVDESSMVDDVIYRDFLSFPARYLFIGDHGQLEPIGKNPGLMLHPDVVLETPMRQALDSEILPFALKLRQGLTRKAGVYGDSLEIRVEASFPSIYEWKPDQVIVGFNSIKDNYNKWVRKKMGYINSVVPGERVVCLKTHHISQVFNGQQGVVQRILNVDMQAIYAELKLDDGRIIETPMKRGQFGQKVEFVKEEEWWTRWDYAYAITCHKAQGSEWDRVAVFENLHPDWDRRRWAYTAATRAKKSLLYVRN